MKTKYEEMTVEQLRKITRERGMTLQFKGKKYTKSELIERLVQDDSDYEWGDKEEDSEVNEQNLEKKYNPEEDDPEEEEIWDVDEIKESKSVEQEIEEKAEKSEKVKQEERPDFAVTLEQIEKRYLYRREQIIYDKCLIPGCIVYFIHYITTKDGKYVKKLRTARVMEVDREKEIVKAETIFHTKFELHFDELLYIRQFNEKGLVPKDLHNFLRKQRTDKGREKIYEAFEQNNYQ